MDLDFRFLLLPEVILIIGWLQCLSKILLGHKVYKDVKCFKGLYFFKNLNELAIFIEFIEVLEAYKICRDFRL